MYHSGSHFFIVPYNATAHQVGNGRQVERELESEDEDDADADADDDGVLDPTTVDWSLLSFHWKGEGTWSRFLTSRHHHVGSTVLTTASMFDAALQLDMCQTLPGEVVQIIFLTTLLTILLTILPTGYTSEAMLDAQWLRLNTQRPDQDWVQELLPDSHHAEHHRRTREPQYGALNGDLAILIGLIAFSSHAGYVERAVKHCIRPVHGEDGGWRTHGRPRAQGCRVDAFPKISLMSQ